MKEFINLVNVTGILVKNNIEEFVTKKGDAAIGGSIILRTDDNSEHEINFFSFKYKKDSNKNFTSEESYFYKHYIDAMLNFKDLEHISENDEPTIISISDGYFMNNDYKTKDGRVVSNNKIFAKFINRMYVKPNEKTILNAKFTVEGIIDSIDMETNNNDYTGNLLIKLNLIRQLYNSKLNEFEADSIMPIELCLPKELSNSFNDVGYYEGCITTFSGQLINSVDSVIEEVKSAFGENIQTKKFNTVIRKYEVKSGGNPSSIFENDLTQDIVDMLKTKREMTIREILNDKSNINSNTLFNNSNEQENIINEITYNPFAQ